MIDLEKLKMLAEAVPTHGPWKMIQGRSGPMVVQVTPAEGSNGFMVAQMVNAGPRTASFIAAVDPQTVLELVMELESLRQAVNDIGQALLEKMDE